MAFNVSDEVMMFVGVVVLAMCISFDVYKAYQRGAKWLPGQAVVIYALCLQLVGYLDAQNVTIASRHKDHQLEVLIANQLSIDSSRLVLLVFVGYLVPGLASTQGLWPNLAALCTSLSTHIAIELYVALHSRLSEEDKVVKGQSGIWLIVSGYAMLESILFFAWVIVGAISRGRFIRDNLGSRIPLALSRDDNNESPENNSETISWETCKSEMLKSWIVARVSQPEYVFCGGISNGFVGHVVTFYVAFFGTKVIFLRSQLHGAFPLFTLQCIFITLGWFVVFYRSFFRHRKVKRYPFRDSLRPPRFQDGLSIIRSWSLFMFLVRKTIKRVKCPVVRTLVEIGLYLFALIFLALPLFCIVVPWYMGATIILCVYVPIVCFQNFVGWLGKKFYSAPSEDKDEDFERYRQALEWVRMPRDDTKNLWVANKRSFNHLKQVMQQAYQKGQDCEKLEKVIGSRLGENSPPSETVKELLEPLESVKRYFPLLKDSFRSITAFTLLRMGRLMDDFVCGEQHFMGDAALETAYEEARELMDFLDCPDNVGISVDTFNISNLEAFALSTAALKPWKYRDFAYREQPTVANPLKSVKELYDNAEEELKGCNLVGEFNSEAVDTNWKSAAQPYAMYKVCKIILDPPRPINVELQNDLFNMFADIIASCVRDSPKILVEHSRKWAAEFREDKIAAAIKLAGFACGVIDKAKMQLRTTRIDRAGMFIYA